MPFDPLVHYEGPVKIYENAGNPGLGRCAFVENSTIKQATGKQIFVDKDDVLKWGLEDGDQVILVVKMNATNKPQGTRVGFIIMGNTFITLKC